jgi:hypothetical protein
MHPFRRRRQAARRGIAENRLQVSGYETPLIMRALIRSRTLLSQASSLRSRQPRQQASPRNGTTNVPRHLSSR